VGVGNVGAAQRHVGGEESLLFQCELLATRSWHGNLICMDFIGHHLHIASLSAPINKTNKTRSKPEISRLLRPASYHFDVIGVLQIQMA